MDDFKRLTKHSSVIQITPRIEKIYKKICEDRGNKLPENNIKEIEFLRTQCKAENQQLCLMSCQTFVRLVENGVLTEDSVLKTFLNLLSNCSMSQYSAITEGIVSIILLSLKRTLVDKKEEGAYVCQYGIKTSQHPIITLMQKESANMNDLVNKIIGICNNNNKNVKNHSIEFLRPVFFYTLCNPQILPDARTVWSALLAQAKVSKNAFELVLEVMSWSRISSPETCYFTSIMVMDVLDHCVSSEQQEIAANLCIYLAVIINHLVGYGLDPRVSFHHLMKAMRKLTEIHRNFYDVLLVLFSKTLHIMSPYYLPDLLRIITFIVITGKHGNHFILNMILDPTIQWIARTSFIGAESAKAATDIIEHVAGKTEPDADSDEEIKPYASAMRNFHPDIGLAFDIVNLAQNLQRSESAFTFIDSLNAKTQLAFCRTINAFLRSLFLSNDLAVDCWFKVSETLLSVVKDCEDVAIDFMMSYLHKLAKEKDPETHTELLKGLPNFATAKDNVPLILHTISNLTNEENASLCLDLYLSLWRIENRTYRFLYEMLSKTYKGEQMQEFQVAKANTIREICLERPMPDLLTHLSDVLNSCADEDGDLATSIALEAVIHLCESDTVDITSTWKELCGKFHHEKRPKSVKSLINFFAQVPLIRAQGIEYEKLLDEAMDYLWMIVTHSEENELVAEALKALSNFDIENTMTLKNIPSKYQLDPADYPPRMIRENHDFTNIPGECWIKLLRSVRPECARNVADLLSHYVGTEIDQLPNVMYRHSERKSEPHDQKTLPLKSILRAIISYLRSQSRFKDHLQEPIVVNNALRVISKKFSKPLPPLEWSFLQNFLYLNFEARKYCILITKNQILDSASAKRILETFLLEFEPNCFEEDLLLLFSILPDLANGVSISVLKTFVDKVAAYCFRESQINNFFEGCTFEKFLESVKYVFPKCEIPEALDIFTPIIERHMDSMDVDSRLFEKYTEAVANLSVQSIDALTSPKLWWEIPIGKLKKATIIRCYLVLYSTKLSNPLTWLGPIIDAYADNLSEAQFFFRHLAHTLYAFKVEENACAWIIDLFRQIQTILVDPSSAQKQEKLEFFLDVLTLAIATFSGCAILLSNLESVATSRDSRIEIFSESLQLLSDRVFWKENEPKIYEYLYHLYKNPLTSEVFTKMLKDAIICSRNRPYFESKSVWTKYVGIRTN